jgi:hypothetical protein
VRNNPIQTNFTAGELTPKLRGRVDVSKYANGVQTLKNFTVYPQGGATRRTGTKFVKEVKTSANFTRLIPFEFSTVQSYILEFGNLYIRFYKDEGNIVNGGGAPVEVVTPYTTAQLSAIQYTQSADVLYLVHPDHAPRKLSRTSHTTWTLTEIDFFDGPYLVENKTATTITSSAATGNVTLTASAALFVSTDVGRDVRHYNAAAAKWGWLTITAFTSSTVVSATVKGDLSAGTATKKWRLGAWSVTTGWPSTVTFFQERLVFGNTTTNPQTIWLSYAGDYENFAPTGDTVYPTSITVTDSNAISYALSSNQVNAIQWLESSSVLVIGTAGGEWIARQASTNQPLSPTNIEIVIQSSFGSKLIAAKRIGQAILFIQRSGRKIREMQFDLNADSYVAKDISILSEHLLTVNGSATDVAYQAEPDGIYWIATSTGRLIGVTYLKDQDVTAFHQHEIGGAFSGGIAQVESVATIPNLAGNANSLYMIVKRTINGSTKRYIEILSDTFKPVNEDDKGFVFLDSSLSYSGAATSTISGLSHLIGQTVGVVANGALRPNVVVAGDGTITLARSCTTATVGLPYTSIIKTLPFEGGGESGTAQGKTTRVHKIGVRVLDSITFKAGSSLDNLYTKEFRQVNDPMDTSPPLFTGNKFVALEQSYTTDPTFFIVQDSPYPLTVLALMPETVVYK